MNYDALLDHPGPKDLVPIAEFRSIPMEDTRVKIYHFDTAVIESHFTIMMDRIETLSTVRCAAKP